MIERHLSWFNAAGRLLHGAVLTRDAWPQGRVIFACRSGTFHGLNGIAGVLDAFLVERNRDNRFSVFTLSAIDMNAEDWVVLPRDYMQETMPTLFERDGARIVD